jgi:hypothetical protein
MGTFAETAIVDYHLSFAERKTNFRFPFPFAENKWKLPFPLVPLAEYWEHGDMEDMETYMRHGDMELKFCGILMF